MTIKDKEILMYRVMGGISQTNIPIVFKGAMITKLIMIENNIEFDRQTRDIDANWIGINPRPSPQEMVDAINKSLEEKFGKQYNVINTRKPEENKSAGFSVFDTTTYSLLPIFTMDVSIKPVTGVKQYECDGMVVKGVLPNEIMADKLSFISGPTMRRRPQDMIDVYCLSKCISFNMQDIIDICHSKNRIIGNFDTLLNKKDGVIYSYNKNQKVLNKPDFESMYEYLIHFVKPLVDKSAIDKQWDSVSQEWIEVKPTHANTDIIARINEKLANKVKPAQTNRYSNQTNSLLTSEENENQTKNEPEL